MMNNNKILTVSYGTFSCTLEGFDDSFGTMKAIAEYFRDLASDDRYFGAEPPQPDAEMLARIAQKEISRRVEAREQEGKIVLSALEDQSVAVPEASAEPTVVKAAAMAAPVIADVADDMVEDASKAQEEPAQPTVEETPTPLVDEVAAQEAQAEQIDETVEATPEAAEVIELETPQEDAPQDIVPGQPDADVEAFFADAQTETEQDEFYEDNAPSDDPFAESPVTAEAITETPEAPAPGSIAAKLQRIRDVVAQNEEHDEDDDYLEDQHAEASKAAATRAADLIAETRDDLEDALSVDEDEFGDDDANDSIMAMDPEGKIEDETDAALSNLFDGDAQGNATPETLRVVGEDDDHSEVHDDGEPAAARARVIKVKRADLEAAIESGDLEEYDEAPEAPKAKERPGLDDLAPAKTTERELSPEDEDELVKELSALEAERGSENGDDTITDEEGEDAPKAAPAARGELPSIDDDAGSQVSRLMAETDHQMDEPESATRRDAFAHLRAAVAARNADEAMVTDADKGDQDGAYRDDLAEVVRPRRPVNTAARTERPGEGRPAPLKLVAEQRIDIERPKNTGPVRPRRVAAAVEAAPVAEDGESFADFAAEMGATKLPQLLEAAAAYMSFVQGHEQFSRPQLMNTVRQAGPEEGFSREDGLRSFGQLLRAGKIEKIKGGRFTVSDEIGFRPDERAAG